MNDKNNGLFIMLDGIDGSGKSTIMDTWKAYLESQGKKVFCLKDYWHTHGTHPTAAELEPYDVLLSAEPTYVWSGAAIRKEMIQDSAEYSPLSLATAYALDRLVLYKRVLLPFRAAGKTILQDRGVSTSLCYQPIQGDISIDTVAAIEGNAFALSHAPDILCIVHISPEHALARLGNRTNKQDNAVFEKLPFLEKAHACFHSELYQNYFKTSGSNIISINTDVSPEIMKQTAIHTLSTLLPIN